LSPDQETCATPVFLLSGFLGSGKTTLITRVLDTERIDASKQAQSAVIVNEFGAVGLDHRMMAEARDDIVDVSGGCFCCSASTPLIETLEKILKKEPHQIIIETSGLSDPQRVMGSILAARANGMPVHIAGVIVLLDSINAIDTILKNEEARQQLASADRVGLTKLDRIAADQRDAVIARLTALVRRTNLLADIRSAELPDEMFTSFSVKSAGFAKQHSVIPNLKDDDHRHNRIACSILESQSPFKLTELQEFLNLLLDRYGNSVIRLKGIVRVEGADNPQIIQAVGSHLAPMEKAHPMSAPEASQIVVFTENLPKSAVEHLFAGFFGNAVIDVPDRTALLDNPLSIPGMPARRP
jgi:G3E family GTPase